MHLVNGTGNSPSQGRPTPGVVEQDKSSRGSIDIAETRLDPQMENVQGQTNQHGLVPTPHPPKRATKKGTHALIGLRSTAGLMAGIVYGGDIQSIGTDH